LFNYLNYLLPESSANVPGFFVKAQGLAKKRGGTNIKFIGFSCADKIFAT
jgi:hypothetical protein